MVNPNERIQGPFGSIFTPSTAATDRAAQILYAEQKQREAKQQAQNAALDDEFAKNLSGIRDADIPDLTKAYTDWKLSYQQGMKQKGGIPPEQQLELLRKKANMYGVINTSKQRKQYEDEVGKSIVSNPDSFEDEAQIRLLEHRKTPLSLLSQNGYDKYDYRYKGTNTDFQKILNSAAGVPRQVNTKEEPVGKDGIQTKITPYMYGNTPLQFKESLLSSLAQRKAGRDAAAIISQVPPELILSVNEKFKSIPPERWKLMGVDKPQELIITGDETPAERYAIHQAQLYALNNEPKEGNPIYRTNEEAKRGADMADWMRKNRITYAQSMQKIAANKQAGIPNQDLGYISDNVADEVGEDVEMKDGTKRRFIDIKSVDPERLDVIIGKDPSRSSRKVQPVEMYDSKTGKTRLVYYQDQETGDWIGKDGQRVSREAAKDRYITKFSPTAFKSKTNTQAQEAKPQGSQSPKVQTKQVKFSDLDPNGFKKEGKYWKYKDGTLFDDKGNVINK